MLNKNLDDILKVFTKTHRQLAEYIDYSEGQVEKNKGKIVELEDANTVIGRDISKATRTLSKLNEILGE